MVRTNSTSRRPAAVRSFRDALLVSLCGSLLAATTANSAATVLKVPLATQEQTEWCWAAVSSAILSYYEKPKSQCEIADYARTAATWHDFGKTNCCTLPSGSCNYWNYNYGEPGSIQDILVHWGVQNSGTNRALTVDETRTQLNLGRPFVIRWVHPDVSGHFVVGYGISDSSLYYMDPWPGEGAKIAKYASVVSSSQNSWTHTNLLSTVPPTAVGPGPARPDLGLTVRSVPEGLSVGYVLVEPARVEFEVLSLRGEVLRSVAVGFRPAGRHAESIPAGSLSSGTYLVQLRSGNANLRSILFVRN